MSTSDVIQLIAILVSLLTSITAITISVITVKQNSNMIEESTRPYIVVYSRVTNFQSPSYYLVIKNLGQAGVIVTSLH